MLGLLSLAIVAAIALVGCSEAPNKGPCPSGYVESGNWRVDGGTCVRVSSHNPMTQANDLVSGNHRIGRDPRPFIRGKILRHSRVAPMDRDHAGRLSARDRRESWSEPAMKPRRARCLARR
jgi:hypothetical protein